MCYGNLITIICKPVNKWNNECVLNAQSVGGKADQIVHYIVERDIDVYVIAK